MESGPEPTDVAHSPENKTPHQPIAEFDYSGHHFKVFNSVSPISLLTQFKVKDETDAEQAEIVGEFRVRRAPGKFFLSKETVFYSIRSNNHEVNHDDTKKVLKQTGHVPHLVAETVAQIVSQGKVDEWNSSTTLSRGGEGMYEYMQTHFADRVKVKHNRYFYKVTRK